METIRTRLERNIGGILTVLILAGCLLVLRPFASALLWAVVLCGLRALRVPRRTHLACQVIPLPFELDVDPRASGVDINASLC